VNLFQKCVALLEAAGSTAYYAPGTGYTARVVHKDGTHTTKFFKDGVHMKSSDYTGKDEDDAHEFAQEEMEFRKKEAMKTEDTVSERIDMPQGHKESPDPITDDSETGKGKIKKQMGNRTPLEIIAKILSKS
jgi:hypothetical protein